MSSPKLKIISYSDVASSMNTHDVQADLEDACKQLALSTVSFMDKFDGVAKQLHSIDMLSLAPPFKPQWDLLRKSLKNLLWHFRTNAGFISARLKMFCTVVLPFTARNSSGARSQGEKLQVLRSFMSISAEHAALTRNLVTNAMKFNNALNTFHTDFSKFVSQRASSQRELRDLSQKLNDLENIIRQLCLANGKFAGYDVTHYAFSIFRMTKSSRRKSSQTRRNSPQRLALNIPELAAIGGLYEQLDITRNEVAHAQYAAQVCLPEMDAITIAQTAMSTLVSDEMITIESGLSLFLSVWSRLMYDCTELLQWVQISKNHSEVPLAIISYLDNGHTLYGTLADALDSFVMEIDPSLFSKS